MPNLRDQWISARADDGQQFRKSVPVSVLADGAFSVGVPPELDPIATRLAENNGKVRLCGESRVHGTELKLLLDFLKACATEFLQCEEVTERVIVYNVRLDCAMWVNPDDTIQQNGQGTESGKWWNLTGHENHREYAVGIGAAVYDRTTYKRTSGDTVKWSLPDSDDLDEDARRLNGFVHLDLSPEGRNLKTMPYSPKAAQFFFKVLLGLCQLAKDIHDFMGDDKRLAVAILQQRGLLEFKPEAAPKKKGRA